jgi:hypothetical protein
VQSCDLDSQIQSLEREVDVTEEVGRVEYGVQLRPDTPSHLGDALQV